MVEHLTVRLADRLPVLDVGDEEAGSDDVVDLGARLPKSVRRDFEGVTGLALRITDTDDSPFSSVALVPDTWTCGPTRTARE